MRISRRLVLGGSASALGATRALAWPFFKGSGAGTPPPPMGGAYVTGQLLGTPGIAGDEQNGWTGMQITVGSSNLSVTALGRWVLSGNEFTHTLMIFDGQSL